MKAGRYPACSQAPLCTNLNIISHARIWASLRPATGALQLHFICCIQRCPIHVLGTQMPGIAFETRSHAMDRVELVERDEAGNVTATYIESEIPSGGRRIDITVRSPPTPTPSNLHPSSARFI